MELTLPSQRYEQSYRNYIAELGNEERYPFPLDFEYADFGALLARLENLADGKDLPAGYVPSSTFWLVEAGELTGVSNLRHFLNPQLVHCGGHIGLGIRPSFRRNGLGSLLLGLTIQQASLRGIARVHIHCYKENTASARIILENHGKLQSEIEQGNQVVQRYTVNASPGRSVDLDDRPARPA